MHKATGRSPPPSPACSNLQEAASRSRNLAFLLGFAPRDSAVVVERCLGNRLFPKCGRGTVCRDSPAQERLRSIFMASPSTVPGRGRGPRGQRDVPAFGTPGIAAHGAPPTFKNQPPRAIWPLLLLGAFIVISAGMAFPALRRSLLHPPAERILILPLFIRVPRLERKCRRQCMAQPSAPKQDADSAELPA